MTGTLALGAGLMVASLVLLGWHLRSWRQVDNGGLSDGDYQFYRRQFVNRLLSSSTIGLIGGLMVGDAWVRGPVKLIYWTGIAALVVVMLLLAMRDWLASRQHFEREAAHHAAEHAQLRAEIERFRRESEGGENS